MFATIPLDTRYDDLRPKITNAMKANCIGEFVFTVSEPCPVCLLSMNEVYDDIECLCNDSEDSTYEREMVVPWDTCKEIYKAMAMEAVISRNES